MHGACERGEPSCDEAGPAPPARRDGAAGRAALAQVHRLGVRLPLRRRDAALDQRHGGRHRHPGLRARGRPARRAALPRGRARGARRLRDAAAPRRAHHRLRGRRALPPVLVRAAPLHLQRVPAVADRAARLRPDRGRRRAPRELFDEAEPEAREEIPLSDVGDWSRYSYRGPEANRDYHELLREFLAVDVHAPARRALLRVRRPLPRLPGRPARADLHRARADDRQAADADPLRGVEAVGGRGEGLPRRQARLLASSPRSGAASAPSPGARAGRALFTVRLGAKELRTGLGKKDRAATEIEVEPAP